MRYKMHPVAKQELAALLSSATARRRGRGASLLGEFADSGEVAVTIACRSVEERNSLAGSLRRAVRASDLEIGVVSVTVNGDLHLLLVNLAKANASVRKAYESRPRVGRRPAKAT